RGAKVRRHRRHLPGKPRLKHMHMRGAPIAAVPVLVRRRPRRGLRINPYAPRVRLHLECVFRPPSAHRHRDRAMNEQMLRELVDDVRDGRLARRDFIAHMVALGVGLPLASAMLADVAVAQPAVEPPYKPTKRGGGGPLRLLLWQGPTSLNPHFATGTKD